VEAVATLVVAAHLESTNRGVIVKLSAQAVKLAKLFDEKPSRTPHSDKNIPLPYARYRFPPEIISYAV
jgi:hypothetical protein